MALAIPTTGELREVDLFDGLSDQELAPWAEAAVPMEVEPGTVVVEPGELPGALLLVDGRTRISQVEDGRSEPIARPAAPTWIFTIAVLTRQDVAMRLEAETRCRILLIEPEPFERLVLATPPVFRRIMAEVEPMFGRITAMESNRERLASLGTMAAGLAHELNNPAAAARRAAEEILEALHDVSDALNSFVEAGVEREDAARLVVLQRQAAEAAATCDAVDALDAADAEDALVEKLEALGVSEPWRVAEPLAAGGVDGEWLDQVARIAGPATDAALKWVAATVSAQNLAGELRDSTEKMSELVGAVKTYAYMDRGELVEVDVHEGLKTTFAVIGHKLKHTSIKFEKDLDKTMPKLTVRGSELNQVWTNLLDNAIDALGDSGTITIRTYRDDTCAVVEIEDDGPGIPPEEQDRIFDAFYTTKEVGKGTGLGLSTVHQIVVDRHNGSIALESEPGRTMFRVRLPFDQSGN